MYDFFYMILSSGERGNLRSDTVTSYLLIIIYLFIFVYIHQKHCTSLSPLVF